MFAVAQRARTVNAHAATQPGRTDILPRIGA